MKNKAGLSSFLQFLLILLISGCAATQHVPHAFVSPSFEIPVGLKVDGFEIRKLTKADAAADYEAVMESREALRTQFGGGWPADTFS